MSLIVGRIFYIELAVDAVVKLALRIYMILMAFIPVLVSGN